MSNLILADFSENGDWRKDLRSEINGVCYGSIRWTARFAGVDNASLGKSLKSAAVLQPSKLAEFLIQKGFEPAVLNQWGETGIPDIGITVILEYYTFEAGRFCNETAKANYRIVASVGMRTLIQQVTGWKPRSSSEPLTEADFLVLYLPESPAKWEARFKADFWAALQRCYGLEQGNPGCARFISAYIYGWFPKSVYDRLNEIDPLQENGKRKVRLHQHFEDKLLTVLEQHIRNVTLCLIKSVDRKQFKKLMRRLPRITFEVKRTNTIAGTQEDSDA